MRKRLWVLGMVLWLCIGTTSVAHAAQIPVVCMADQVDATEMVVEENASDTADNYKYGIFGVMLLGGAVLVGSAVIVKNRHQQ